MIKEKSIMVVHFVEQQLEGWTFERAHWPLHITLIPWFSVEDEEAVIRSLERVAGEVHQMQLRVGEQAMFGSKSNIPVNVIKNQAPVRALHEILMHSIEETDISFDEEKYMRDSYVAHITRHKRDKRFSSEGEVVALDDFHLVRLIDKDTCRVEQHFMMKP